MSRAWLWFILSCKRQVRRISFLLILLILPAAAGAIRSAESHGGTNVRIAVYADDSPFEQKLAKYLVFGKHGGMQAESGDPIFRFYLCESEQQVKDEVASRKAECGYVFAENLEERLNEKNYKRSIRVYSAPSTVAAELSTEVVFSALMELYDKELFTDFVENSEIFDAAATSGSPERAKLTEEAAELYEKWMNNGSTFSFAGETLPAGGEIREESAGPPESVGSRKNPGPPMFPVRGIVAVYIFIIGMYSAVMNLEDERRGLFLAVSYRSRPMCRFAALAAPVCLSALSGLAALMAGGVMGRFDREIPALLFYVFATALSAFVLRTFIRSESVICCLIPFFLIGSLVFCPIVIDVGRYLPSVAPVQRLFLPWHYLQFFK